MEDLMIEINDEYYVVEYSARKDPCQMVWVWHKKYPIATKLFEVNYRASTGQVIEFINIYLRGYYQGCKDGAREIQEGIKKLLSIRS